jgi:hypothetical protein
VRRTSAINAMMPPSPRLSARIMNVTYLMVTIRNSDHTIKESTPSTLSWVSAT